VLLGYFVLLLPIFTLAGILHSKSGELAKRGEDLNRVEDGE
jgi:hypothetical protein